LPPPFGNGAFRSRLIKIGIISGMNYQAQPLQLHEIAKMTASTVVLERIVISYTLMLDFYGMKLLSSDTGLIGRSDSYQPRYRNLLGE
jgi:hypothetical protein